MTTLRIATRGSDLALAQSRTIGAAIRRLLDVETELVVIKTTGDRIQNQSLAKIGGKGLFVKEIEEALLDGRADLAVHSAKDLPAALADGLEIAVVPERADARDALVGRESGARIASLPDGARVGTGSTRRAAQLLAKRPDLVIVPLRGNVPTRLHKLESDALYAVVLACAGLDRLGLSEHIDERIAPEWMLPAVAQGALAVEARSGDSLVADLEPLNDPEAVAQVSAERGFLLRVGGDCTVPLAVHATVATDRTLLLRALIASPDGRRVVSDALDVAVDKAAEGGAELADRVLSAGGTEILDALRAAAEADVGEA
jgi:hydroxymethylbilane synthase